LSTLTVTEETLGSVSVFERLDADSWWHRHLWFVGSTASETRAFCASPWSRERWWEVHSTTRTVVLHRERDRVPRVVKPRKQAAAVPHLAS
jgi:hypothetical protein